MCFEGGDATNRKQTEIIEHLFSRKMLWYEGTSIEPTVRRTKRLWGRS